MLDGMIRETQMGQLGFFDVEERLAALSAKGDPLEAIGRLVPWESLRSDIESVVLTADGVRKRTRTSSAARRPTTGRRSRPRTGRKTRMHAGRRSTAKAFTATRTT